MAVAVVAVTAWLGRRASPRARMALWVSALVISAAMFLPMSLLRALLPAEVLLWLEAAAGALSLELADVAHLVAFAWLGMVLWTLRPDLRGWRAVAVLALLAVAAEWMQGLTVERFPRAGDVGINLLGAGVGLVLAVAASALWKVLRAPRTDDR